MRVTVRLRGDPPYRWISIDGKYNRDFRVSAMSTFAVVQHEEQRQRYEAKLRRELGELVLSHLADASTKDILLNPDSILWIKRIGEGFASVGGIT